jgi:Ni,Fe-hydrogenase I large subunit
LTRIVVDPVSRIEGHMGVTVEVDDTTNLVTSAKCSAVMFRGFETIVLGRDPRDCAPILSAICGVCHSDHHINSVRAIENAAGMTSYPGGYASEQTTIPQNAVLSRNIIQGADWSYSHAAHLLALAGPDYELYDLLQVLSQSVLITSYADLLKYAVIPAQAYMHQLITLWGGKTPHQRASIPGGNPVRPTSEVIEQSLNKVSNLRSILDDVVPVVWNFLTADAVRLSSLGPGPGNFLSLGAYPDPTITSGTSMMPLVLPRGVITSPGTTPAPFDPTQMTETIPYSWYNQPLSSQVIGEQTPVPDQTNPSAYSWAKSPRYQGNPMEVGPLAREYVAGIYPKLGKVINGIIPSVPGLPLNPNGSVFDRLVCRALELVALIGSNNTQQNLTVLGQPLNLSLVDVLTALGLPTAGLIQTWLGAMDVNAPACTSYSNPTSGQGIGLWEAPRGSLLHWISIDGGKVNNYQVVAPTTWNVSPVGPLEGALVGTPIGTTGTNNDLRQAAWVVRSFDLCLACTVHAVDAKGNKRYLRAG